MNGRNARKVRMMRHMRWMMRNHPHDAVVPRCFIRDYNRWVAKQNRWFRKTFGRDLLYVVMKEVWDEAQAEDGQGTRGIHA